MAIPNSVKQDLADAWAGDYQYVSVHTGAAGTTGTNEASGGSYVRKKTTFTAGSTGVDTGSEVEIPVAAGTYKEGGLFSAASSGNFGGSAAFTGGDVVVSGSGASVKVTPTINLSGS